MIMILVVVLRAEMKVVSLAEMMDEMRLMAVS